MKLSVFKKVGETLVLTVNLVLFGSDKNVYKSVLSKQWETFVVSFDSSWWEDHKYVWIEDFQCDTSPVHIRNWYRTTKKNLNWFFYINFFVKKATAASYISKDAELKMLQPMANDFMICFHKKKFFWEKQIRLLFYFTFKL